MKNLTGKPIIKSTNFAVAAAFVCFFLVSCSLKQDKNVVSETQRKEETFPNKETDSKQTEDVLPDNNEIVAPPLNFNFSQSDDEYIYYTYSGKIQSFNKKTSEVQLIYESQYGIYCIEKYEDFLYFIEEQNDDTAYKLCSISVDGKSFSVLGLVEANCLGRTDKYLFVRFMSADGTISDTLYEMEKGKVQRLEEYSVNYTFASEQTIDTDGKKLLKNEKVLLEVDQDEYIRLKTYNNKYLLADILDEDGTPKQLLLYKIEQQEKVLFDNEKTIYVELHDDWGVFLIYGEAISIRVIDFTTLPSS